MPPSEHQLDSFLDVEEISGRPWTFFSHHAHVLISLARDPTLRLRDIAEAVGVTERATATLVSELVHAGYLQRFKDGRRNHYRVNLSGGLRHPLIAGVAVGDVFSPLLPPGTFIHRDAAQEARLGADVGASLSTGASAEFGSVAGAGTKA